MTNLLFMGAAVAALVSANDAAATTITFGAAPQGMFTTYSEGGYTVTAKSNGIMTGPGFGDPAPSIFGFDSGSLAVTGSAPFSFAGFSGGSGNPSNSNTVTFIVSGFLNNQSIYTQTFTHTGGFAFTKFTANSALAFDRLDFAIRTSLEDASFNVDNIVVNSAIPAVPEPATWAMMLTGFGMVAGAARYRRRSAIVKFA